MFRNLRKIPLIINQKTLVVVILAVISTRLCIQFEILAKFPLTLIGTAIVFPIVFSIGGAYKRRERALAEYGNLKAHGRAIFFATRDWMDESHPESLDRARQVLGDVLATCRTMFIEPEGDVDRNEEDVYRAFSSVSKFIRRELRDKGLASGEVSRCNQFLSKMIIAFENIKHIFQYRTPRTLRTYSELFIVVLPILYGPYFAQLAQDVSPGLEYMMPIFFCVILVSLDNIQSHLENPFDQVGEDDIEINAEKFVERLTA